MPKTLSVDTYKDKVDSHFCKSLYNTVNVCSCCLKTNTYNGRIFCREYFVQGGLCTGRFISWEDFVLEDFVCL